MGHPIRAWWNRLQVQQKVWTILLVVFLPLVGALVAHVTLIDRLVSTQQQHHQIILASEQINVLRRLSVDIEAAFRGYLLTREDMFLAPMAEAEARLEPTTDRALALVQGEAALTAEIRAAHRRLAELLESKHRLIGLLRAGQDQQVLDYVSSGKGILLSDRVRDELRAIEDRLGEKSKAFEQDEARLAQRAYWGLVLAVVGGLALGLIGSRLLTRSITGPLSLLKASVVAWGAGGVRVAPAAIQSSDEIGQLARSYEDMARRIQRQIQELEAISAIGHAINMIGPDGLDGVLRRIVDRAADLLQVDVCLVMSRNEQMGCWIVEAASGEWNDRLHKTVMLWEEFPVSVRAYETREPAFGEELRSDRRPEVVRRNLMGESMLSIPLLAQGVPFGVLILLLERRVPQESWNLRLAKGFAEEAAIAIANARLYEAAHAKERGLEARLRQLEHLAETLAHDLKAPGERMEELASLLVSEYGGQLEPKAGRWLALIAQNGKDLIQRVENILTVARVGARHEAVEAVDPGLVLEEVLKSWAGDLERGRVRVEVPRELPLVACHRAYLRQVLDNLTSNALKFCSGRPDPTIRIEAVRREDRVHFAVSDNGVGIPLQHLERVFEPFVRLQPSTKGSGIGLAIVKRIIELYGGHVFLESEEGRGCTVRFTLPALGEMPPSSAQGREPALVATMGTGLVGRPDVPAAGARGPGVGKGDGDAGD